MNIHKKLFIVVIIFIQLQLFNQQIIITCEKCQSLCSSGVCAVFHGQRISLSQQSSDKSCIDSCDGYPIKYNPDYCQSTQDGVSCSSNCCVRSQRLMHATKICANTLGYTFNASSYCNQSYTPEQGFAILVATLIMLCIVFIIMCCIHEKCFYEKEIEKEESKKKKNQHVRNSFQYQKQQNNPYPKPDNFINKRQASTNQVFKMNQYAQNPQSAASSVR